ncbi:MAG: hypothetical protein O2942_09215 [Proteobacteria bacterium]|nr:hypothetical protein [Pseudomonadota bacterium]
MPTIEDTLSDVSVEIAQLASDVTAIGEASTANSGLIKLSSETNPDNNTVPTVAFFKNRNMLGASGEAGGGLPQAQLNQIAALPTEAALVALATLPVAQISALPATAVLTALGTLPASLTGLAGQIIAVNATGDGYEIITAPTGGGGTLPTSIVVDHFTGDNSTAAFTLSQSPADANALGISVGGMSIDPAIYNVAGTTLTFNDAPPVTDTNAIVVRHLGTVAAIDDNSILTIKIANKAVTLTKMADGTPGKFLKYNDSTGVIEEGDPTVGTVGDNTISTTKVIDKNITLPKLADGTPGKSLKYNDSTGVIEETDIVVPDNAIVTSKLFNKAVTLGKIADGTPGKLLKFNESTGVIEEVDIAGISGGMVHVTRTTVSSSVAQVDIEDASLFDGTYKQLMVIGSGIRPVTQSSAGHVYCRVKTQGVYRSDGNYRSSGHDAPNNGGHNVYSDNSAILIVPTWSSHSHWYDFKTIITNPASTTLPRPTFMTLGNQTNDGGQSGNSTTAGIYETHTTLPLQGLRFFFANDNTTGGNIDVYGLK